MFIYLLSPDLTLIQFFLSLSFVVFQFAKFTKPSDVPLHFLQSRVPLQGTVRRVEPSSTKVLLMVDHRSLLPFPRFSNKTYLPVKIGGVDITGNGRYRTDYGIHSCCSKRRFDLVGVSWLQTVLNGKLITFLPIVREKEYLECVVTMPEKDQVRETEIMFRIINVYTCLYIIFTNRTR